ncbi:MAG: hypothetical protein ABFR90_08055 [Planctomycetota bacterium]
MQRDIKRKLFRTRIRLALNKLIDISRCVLLYASILALAAVAVEKLLAIRLVTWPLVWSFSVVCGAVMLAWWFIRIPSKQKTSLLIDEKLKLKERMSSLMVFETSDDVFAQAACRESTETIGQANLQKQFPISLSKSWFYSLGMWLTVALLIAFLPQYDLLGNLERKQQDAKSVQEIELAEKTVELTTNSVKLAVKQFGDKDLESELEALSAMPAEQSPEAVKRQAIQKLGNLSDKIKQLEAGLNADTLEMTKKMLKQLKPMSDAFSQKLQQAMSKGDWGAARDMLKQFQKQLEQGQMSKEQQQQLSKQLEDLSKQLEQLASQKKSLEDELAKHGLDKKLANLSEKELRKMLEKQGLSPEQLEQLLQKLSACKSASRNCSSMAKAMAACSDGAGGLGADELGDLAAQLNNLESFEQRVKMMQASLAEIENAMNCLGQGMCQGSGAKSPWGPGSSSKSGAGTGGPGRGFGSVDKDTDGQTATKATRLQNKDRQGQIVASWYFKGEQVKGESSKELDQVIQTARDNAAEAISDNEIPRRYEESVKNYFGGLEEKDEP